MKWTIISVLVAVILWCVVADASSYSEAQKPEVAKSMQEFLSVCDLHGNGGISKVYFHDYLYTSQGGPVLECKNGFAIKFNEFLRIKGKL